MAESRIFSRLIATGPVNSVYQPALRRLIKLRWQYGKILRKRTHVLQFLRTPLYPMRKKSSAPPIKWGQSR